MFLNAERLMVALRVGVTTVLAISTLATIIALVLFLWISPAPQHDSPNTEQAID